MVVLATSRDAMQRKLELLNRSAASINMKIHPSKSKFIVANSTDHRPFDLGDSVVHHTAKYIYIGAPISCNSIKFQVDEHIEAKSPNVHKFAAFCSKNRDAPFTVKKKVWSVALMSSILYSSETWMTDNITTAE
jgi:hypothetical protein